MQLRLLLIASLFPLIATSQNSSSIDFVFGLDCSYRNLINSEETEFHQVLINSREVETKKLNWNIGFFYNKQLTKTIFIKSGFRLATIGYKGEKLTGIRWGSEHDGNGGYQFDPTLPHEIQNVYEYWFIEIPLEGRMEFGKGKLKPFVEFGFAPSIYLSLRTIQLTDIGNESNFSSAKPDTFNSFQLVGIGSFGINYNISANFQIYLNPAFRYYITSLNNDSISEHFYNYGLDLGIRKKL